MDSELMMSVDSGERVLIEQLRANPALGEKLKALLASARAEQLGMASADEAEERIVEQLRAVGTEAMQGWAEASEARIGVHMQALDATARVRTKKNSTGTAPLDR
jgi:hypothetical protein